MFVNASHLIALNIHHNFMTIPKTLPFHFLIILSTSLMSYYSNELTITGYGKTS